MGGHLTSYRGDIIIERLTRQTLCDTIIQKGREMGLDDEHVKLYHGNCHHHLHNILVESGQNHLSSKLSHLLCEDLAIIPPHLCVTCKIGDILHFRHQRSTKSGVCTRGRRSLGDV